jgi:hypothetical protein
MRKKDRHRIFEKYSGRCAYCGCELQKGWHVDEIEPVRRGFEYARDENGIRVYNMEKHKWEGKVKLAHPERMNIENQNPACASCNINKHSDSLEQFRSLIIGFINSLNRDSTQYKIAKRYGLIKETGIDVKFYFETLILKDTQKQI